jgi:hypothetical protein
VETDPIYAADSATLLHFTDTLATLATKYDLDTLSRPTITGTVNRIPIFNGIHSIGNSPFYTSGADTALLSTNKTTGSFGKNLFAGSGGQQVTSPTDIYQGSQNTTFGIGAGDSITSGDVNTFVGRMAGNSTKSGFSNIMIGGFAGQSNNDGTSNIMIGNSAGKYFVGTNPLTSPNGGLYIGHNTVSLLENQQNEIVIGNSAVGHGSNTATYGDLNITDHYFGGVINSDDSVLVALRAYNATTFKNSKRAVSEDAFRDKIESLSTGAPGGSDNQLQYKNGTAFAGATSFLYYNTGDSAALKTDLRIQRDEFLGFGNAYYTKMGYVSSGTHAGYWVLGNSDFSKQGILYNPSDGSVRLKFGNSVELTTELNIVNIEHRLNVYDSIQQPKRAYNATTWNNSNRPAGEDAVRDKFESLTAGAPVDATYITQTANATLTNEQALGALGTGILKNTTTTGVLSIASAGDFPTLNQNTTGTAQIGTTVATASETGDSQCFPTFIAATASPQGIKYDATYYQYDASAHKLTVPTVNATTGFQVNGVAIEPIYSVKKSYSNDSIKNAYEVPLTVIAAPGSGKAVVVDCALTFVRVNYSSSAFTATGINLFARGVADQSLNGQIVITEYAVNTGSTIIAPTFATATLGTEVAKDNQPILLKPQADITAGGGSIDLYIVYRIITL